MNYSLNQVQTIENRNTRQVYKSPQRRDLGGLHLLVFSSLIFPISCFAGNKTKNPNVLVIIADDLGWGDIGYNNPEHVYTPNLDRLSESGATFTQHYVMPQSTPTRVSLFTGRYPGRFPYSGNVATNDKCFDVGTPTLATMLKTEGYRTYLSGKWHMGSDSLNGPQFHGFDESYGAMGGACGMYNHRYRPGRYEQTWHRNQKTIEGSENGIHVTDLMTLETQRVIREKSKRPFFMMLTYHAPHTPLDERGDFVNQPTQSDPDNPTRWLNEDKIKWFNDPEGIIQSEPDMQKRLLLAAVYHLDNAIGKVVRALEEEGKLENTIILFSSDNGPQVRWSGNQYPDDLKLTNFNQLIPMRGSKVDVYEGGIHVPGFIYWKGKIKPKKVDTPVHIIDWFPTLASIAGHKKSKTYKLDGLDLSPVIFKNKEIQSRDLYWIWENNINRWALRYGDWKIVKYGINEPRLEEWSLYNLKTDPKEKNNVAKSNPEKLKELHERFLVQRAKDAR
jgi:arylsulfatase A-like enzyme